MYPETPITVITISRQMGSLGKEISQYLADRLGYRLACREIINQAAIQVGSPEIALAAIDELGLLGICPSPQACEAYRLRIQVIMDELAAVGNVIIVGRAGQVILANHPNVFHVQIVAPYEIRTGRVSNDKCIPIEFAQKQVKASDHFRRHYLQKFYNVRWDDPTLYNLVINTGHLSPATAAQIILTAINQPKPEATESIL